jgi:hypothetical protein
MEHYGHILTLYNSSDTTLKRVKKMISENNFPFVQIENTFFYGTSSMKKSKEFQQLLAQSNITYTVFFLFNPDGSDIKATGVDNEMVNRVKDIFFNDI